MFLPTFCSSVSPTFLIRQKAKSSLLGTHKTSHFLNFLKLLTHERNFENFPRTNFRELLTRETAKLQNYKNFPRTKLSETANCKTFSSCRQIRVSRVKVSKLQNSYFHKLSKLLSVAVQNFFPLLNEFDLLDCYKLFPVSYFITEIFKLQATVPRN